MKTGATLVTTMLYSKLNLTRASSRDRARLARPTGDRSTPPGLPNGQVGKRFPVHSVRFSWPGLAVHCFHHLLVIPCALDRNLGEPLAEFAQVVSSEFNLGTADIFLQSMLRRRIISRPDYAGFISRLTETTVAAMARAKGTQKPSRVISRSTSNANPPLELPPPLRSMRIRNNSALKPAHPASASGTHASYFAAMRFQIQIPIPARAASTAIFPFQPQSNAVIEVFCDIPWKSAGISTFVGVSLR